MSSVRSVTPPISADVVHPARLRAQGATVSFGDRTVFSGLDLDIPHASFTVIIGANASGKSTLLRSLARLVSPSAGQVVLDGAAIDSLPSRVLARQVGILPQSSLAPEGISVIDLVSRGRHPHQGFLRRWSVADERAVASALERTGLSDLSTRPVDELSGGQRQRAWIAMALAQETPILLLDEPTTFLDIAHQLEVLELCRSLQEEGRTLVAVLHDLNQAARYATHLVALSGGAVVAEGPPSQVVTEHLVREVFGVDARIIVDPETGGPLVIPRAVRR